MEFRHVAALGLAWLAVAAPGCALDVAGVDDPVDAGFDRPTGDGEVPVDDGAGEETALEEARDSTPADRGDADADTGLDTGPDADSLPEADAEADTSVEAEADGYVDAGCTPGTRRCTGSVLELCSSAGSWEAATTCPLGCVAAESRCAELVPSGGIDPTWVGAGTAAFEPTQDLLVNTDTGIVTVIGTGLPITGVVFHAGPAADCGGGHSIGVGAFSFTTIDIPDGVTVRVAGARAVAFLASGPVRIAGLIDARGGLSACGVNNCAGPGGFAGGTAGDTGTAGMGPGGGGAGTNGGCAGDEAGGGGGGSCGAGGAGGSVGATIPGGAGGIAYLRAALAPSCGGSGGGAGAYGCGGASYATQHGGGGGGAVQIVSADSVSFLSTSPVAPTGVNVGGGAGAADHITSYDDGGGGGGAGGSILVEAPAIIVDAGATLAAGGGGGAGGYNAGANSIDGSDGLLGDTPAPGGGGTNAGGNGGAGSAPGGANAAGTSDGGAGGGGGAGRIRLATAAATPAVVHGVVSPHAGSTCFSTSVVGSR